MFLKTFIIFLFSFLFYNLCFLKLLKSFFCQPGTILQYWSRKQSQWTRAVGEQSFLFQWIIFKNDLPLFVSKLLLGQVTCHELYSLPKCIACNGGTPAHSHLCHIALWWMQCTVVKATTQPLKRGQLKQKHKKSAGERPREDEYGKRNL